MKVTRRQLQQVLHKLQVETVHASHHLRGFVVVDGKRVLALHLPLAQVELPIGVVQRFRQSLGLSAPEFKRLVSCHMSRSEYLEIIRGKGVLDADPTEALGREGAANAKVFQPSCFLSYSAADEDFTDKLYTDLRMAGIDCWFAPHDLAIGDDIREAIATEMRARKTVVLVLSRNSIDSEWVEVEVRQALLEEAGRGSKVLFPIRIDDAAFDPGKGWYREIRRRLIGDFRSWNDHACYLNGLKRLLRDLRA